jgi:ribosomal protein L35
MSARKSIKKRIKITGSGKLRRRATGLGHSKANKSRKEIKRKKGARGLNFSTRNISKDL